MTDYPIMTDRLLKESLKKQQFHCDSEADDWKDVDTVSQPIKAYRVIHDDEVEEISIYRRNELLSDQVYILPVPELRKIFIYNGRKAPVMLRSVGVRFAEKLRHTMGSTLEVVPLIEGLHEKELEEILHDVPSSTKAPPPIPPVKPMSPRGANVSRTTEAKSPEEIIRQALQDIAVITEKVDRETELGELLEKRLEYYQKALNITREIADHIVRLFSEGIPLTHEDTENHTIRDFLIPLDESERAYNQILKGIKSCHRMRGYSFVFGDFGTGKSQLFHEIIDEIKNWEKLIVIPVNAGLGAPELFKTTSRAVKDYFFRHPDENFAPFETPVLHLDRTNINDYLQATGTLVKLLQSLTSHGYRIVLLIDEMAKIEPGKSFETWIDALSSIHDSLRAGYYAVFFMRERDVDRLFSQDERTERFSKWLYEPFLLTRNYGDRILEGTANILALYSIANDVIFSENSTRTIETVFKGNTNLEEATLRKVNVLAYTLANILAKFETQGHWRSLENKLTKLNDEELRHELSSVIISLLPKVDVFFEHQDMNYKARFVKHEYLDPENLEIGYYIMEKEKDEIYMDIMHFPVLLSLSIQHDTNKISYKASESPVICFTLLDHRDDVKLIDEVLLKKQFEKQLQLITFYKDALLPCLLYPTQPQNFQEKNLARLLRTWFTIVTDLRAELNEFLKHHAEQKRILEMQDEINELKALIQQMKLAKAKQSGIILEDSDLRDHGLFIVISAFELVKSRKHKSKAISTMANDLVTTMKDQHKQISKTQARGVIQEVINELRAREFLKVTDKFLIKTEKWNKEDILAQLL